MDTVLGHCGPLSCAVPEALLPVGDLSTHVSAIILLVFKWSLQGPCQDQQKATSRSGLHHRERPLAAAGPVGAAGRTSRRPRVSRGTRRHRTHQGLTRDRHAVRCGPAGDLDQATAHWRALGGPTRSTEAPSKRPATVHRRELDQSRPVRDHHETSSVPEAAPRSAIRHSMGSEWPFWTLSGLVWVWSVSLSGHADAMICPLRDQKGSSDAGPDRYLEHPPATPLGSPGASGGAIGAGWSSYGCACGVTDPPGGRKESEGKRRTG